MERDSGTMQEERRNVTGAKAAVNYQTPVAENLQWETLIPALNPISYSMMGLLPQNAPGPKNNCHGCFPIAQ
jgi:hypothetical protein